MTRVKAGIYALYKGDDLLAIGTYKELAKAMDVEVNTIKIYGRPSYRKRVSEKGRRLIRIE